MFYVYFELDPYFFPEEPTGPYFVPNGYETRAEAEEAEAKFRRENPHTYTWVCER